MLEEAIIKTQAIDNLLCLTGAFFWLFFIVFLISFPSPFAQTLLFKTFFFPLAISFHHFLFFWITSSRQYYFAAKIWLRGIKWGLYGFTLMYTEWVFGVLTNNEYPKDVRETLTDTRFWIFIFWIVFFFSWKLLLWFLRRHTKSQIVLLNAHFEHHLSFSKSGFNFERKGQARRTFSLDRACTSDDKIEILWERWEIIQEESNRSLLQGEIETLSRLPRSVASIVLDYVFTSTPIFFVPLSFVPNNELLDNNVLASVQEEIVERWDLTEAESKLVCAQMVAKKQIPRRKGSGTCFYCGELELDLQRDQKWHIESHVV